MNLQLDLTEENQQLLHEIGIESENREYSKEEIKTFSNSICDLIFSKSSNIEILYCKRWEKCYNIYS